MATKKPRGLGRGLDALLGIDTSGGDATDATSGEFRTLPAKQLQPGRYQPRTGMDPERLTELAESIKRGELSLAETFPAAKRAEAGANG